MSDRETHEKHMKKEPSSAQQRRCIGFDWRMSQHDCEHLKRNGMIPSFTKSCGYSNSGTLAMRWARDEYSLG
jgi:hypothetical protein